MKNKKEKVGVPSTPTPYVPTFSPGRGCTDRKGHQHKEMDFPILETLGIVSLLQCAKVVFPPCRIETGSRTLYRPQGGFPLSVEGVVASGPLMVLARCQRQSRHISHLEFYWSWPASKGSLFPFSEASHGSKTGLEIKLNQVRQIAHCSSQSMQQQENRLFVNLCKSPISFPFSSFLSLTSS
jgi:hypothetical protein